MLVLFRLRRCVPVRHFSSEQTTFFTSSDVFTFVVSIFLIRRICAPSTVFYMLDEGIDLRISLSSLLSTSRPRNFRSLCPSSNCDSRIIVFPRRGDNA